MPRRGRGQSESSADQLSPSLHNRTTMSSPLSISSRRISLPQCVQISQQTRNATLLRRPKRPYTFTQLVTLTDGSTYLHRTTSPSPVYKVTKDVRNSPLWNPSSQKLLNIEEDDAGKLKAFRSKFGRGWDGETEQEAIEVHIVLFLHRVKLADFSRLRQWIQKTQRKRHYRRLTGRKV
jgi:hypothetical protein